MGGDLFRLKTSSGLKTTSAASSLESVSSEELSK